MRLAPLTSSPDHLDNFGTVQFGGQSIPLGADKARPRFESTKLDEVIAFARHASHGDAGAMVILRRGPGDARISAYDIVNLEDGPFRGQPLRFEGRQDLPGIWRWSPQLVAIVDGASWVSPPR